MHTPAQATSGTYRRGGKKTIFLFLSLISHSEKDNKKRKEEKWAPMLCVCTRTAAAYKQRAAREKNPHTDLLYLFLDSADVFGVRGAW